MSTFTAVIASIGIALMLAPGLASAQMIEPPISPVFNPDRTVTLRISAPEAGAVSAVVEFMDGPQKMTKGDDGIWEVILGPAEPKIYDYNFLVDGVPVIDPMNPAVKLSLTPDASLLNYPGEYPMFYDEQQVPHGVLHTHHFFSENEQANRALIVYTPPDYDPAESYPVLYLLHGYSDAETGWTAVGRAHFILDNLIAEGAAKSMIIAMPFGYSEPRPGDADEWDPWFGKVYPRVERNLLEEVIPLVESSYATAPGAANRAIAGLSMGGAQTLAFGLGNRDMFDWIGAFSSAVIDDIHQPLLADPAGINRDIKLLWIGCGTEDFLYERNMAFINTLKQKNIAHVALITEGSHTWWVWRNYLHELAPLLFR